MKEKIIKRCETCGIEFEVQPCFKDKKYCSIECYHLAKPRITKICEICGITFEVINSRKDTARFCSMKCQGVWQSKFRVGEDGANWQGGDKTKICLYCGCEYFCEQNIYESSKFCSNECKWLWQSNIKGESHPQYKEKIVIICEYCGESFEVHQCYGGTARFCSVRCYHKYIRDNPVLIDQRIKQSCSMRGIEVSEFDDFCYNTKDRRLDNPKYREWRESIFERDDYTCQMCDERGGELNAHHILRWIDYPELGLDIDNGITLCVRCHNLTKFHEKEFEAEFLSIILTN